MAAKRLLYISGSIGLGHASRDVAIARELRRLQPGLEIDWLAGQPAGQLIEEAGETVLAESATFADTGFAESAAGDFSLNLVRYVLRASGAWARSARTFLKLTAERSYDFVVADEFYALTIAFGLMPKLKKVPLAMIYDFLGVDAMGRNPFDRALVHALNRIWSGGQRGSPPPFDLTLFIGEPEDIADRPFGYRLPNRQDYARRHFHFVGYTLPFDPAELPGRVRQRAGLGYGGEPLVVCSVGGTAVGASLLRLCAAAFPHVAERVPDARMVLVCGPRIDPGGIDAPPGVEIRGYVPRLYEHLAGCDVAVVQGGGTTTLELTALRRPFVYFPLEGHFEQSVTVAEQLARHRAGRRMLYSKTTPAALADAVVDLLAVEPDWPPIPTDGARRAAELISVCL